MRRGYDEREQCSQAVRLGRPYASIVTACAAVMTNGSNARTLLEKVPAEVRQDLGYTLCRIHWLLRNNGVAEATRLMLAAPRDAMAAQDTDQWWRERRVLARELLDLGDVNTAYQIVGDAAAPANEYYRAEFHFMAGWIALRFLNDPTAALTGRPIPSCWRGLAIGEAVLPTQPVGCRKRVPITRLPLGIPLLITASWHAPSWGSVI